MHDSRGPKRCVVVLSLAAIVLLAAAVCALHAVNALTLRGTARSSDYAQPEGTGETLAFCGSELPLLADGGLRLAPQVETTRFRAACCACAACCCAPARPWARCACASA